MGGKSWRHPFWSTHFPPNGWGCQCRVTPVAEPKAGDATSPPDGWDARNSKGALPGVDRGFDYAPGASTATSFREFIDARLIRLDGQLGAEMYGALRPVLAVERELAWWDTLDGWLADEFSRKHTAIVGTLDETVVAWLSRNMKPTPVTAEIAVRDNLPKGAKQLRHEAAQNALTLEEWRALPSLLDSPGAVYSDNKSQKLIFVANELGPMKAALEFNPQKNRKFGMNMIEAGFRVSDESISGAVKGGEWTQLK